jgi:hypothetical protein
MRRPVTNPSPMLARPIADAMAGHDERTPEVRAAAVLTPSFVAESLRCLINIYEPTRPY